MENFYKEYLKNENKDEEEIEDFYNSLQKLKDDGYDISTSKFIKFDEEKERIIFSICKNNEMSYVAYDTFSDIWIHIDKYYLKVNNNCKLDGIDLLPNSSDKIEYELYAFQQCEELDLDVLFPNEKLEQIDFDDSDYSKYLIKWTDELTLLIECDENYDNNQYKVLLNGKFFSGFNDENTNFQIGDCCTNVYKK